ncbi:putative caspase-like protein [Pseudarthrobacter sp. W1I19]|uniref:caspase family protein n=1 Tax=Pseudarthrobacter sp. W1I19 TaxID=3042288 RepID=UPI0027864FBC|nr:caspase family protein [Pseudarthrobacter sp. W1I19]MDQ0922338.1 putative caspase-like protein [Pseudarthrobacter sp. W1I19]
MQSQTDAQRRIALIIGTSTYQESTLAHLRAPGTDTQDLAEVLSDSQIGKFDVHTFLDAPHDRLMRGVMEVCSSVGPGDLILVYLSCHGLLDERGRLYYATTNTERKFLAATSVAAAWLNDQLEDCRARSQILVLDCCHSGAFAKSAKGDEALALQDKFPGRGKVVLTASRATEYSFEGTEVVGKGVRSVFTKAIVDGLKTGAADVNGDGDVTVADLYQYVFNKVRQEEPRQTPTMWTYGSEGDLLVARSVRKREIRPAPLPADIVAAIESPRPRVRASGVAELADLRDSGPPELALAAENALRKMAEEEVPSVAELARAALDSARGNARHSVDDRSKRETAPGASAEDLEPGPAGAIGSSQSTSEPAQRLFPQSTNRRTGLIVAKPPYLLASGTSLIAAGFVRAVGPWSTSPSTALSWLFLFLVTAQVLLIVSGLAGGSRATRQLLWAAIATDLVVWVLEVAVPSTGPLVVVLTVVHLGCGISASLLSLISRPSRGMALWLPASLYVLQAVAWLVQFTQVPIAVSITSITASLTIPGVFFLFSGMRLMQQKSNRRKLDVVPEN